MNPYRDYLVRKYGYEDTIEVDGAFLFYKIVGEECVIGEIYTPQEMRQSGVATAMADKCTEIALSKGCKWLTCQTEITGNDDELSMLAILHYGFKPIKVIPGERDRIIYAKWIGGQL